MKQYKTYGSGFRNFVPPPKPQETKLEEPQSTEIRGTLPKGWSPENKSKELEEISQNIKHEKQKIDQQKRSQMKSHYVQQN